MHLMHEEDVVGDTYLGFIHVFEADEEGVSCDRCHTKMFCGQMLIAFDGSGEGSSFDDITNCEACLTNLASQAQRRATESILKGELSSCSLQWTETLSPRFSSTSSDERTIVMRFDWDDGLPCDRCKIPHVIVPIFSFDGTGGLYDSLDVCETCVKDLLNIGRTSMMSVTLDRMAID